MNFNETKGLCFSGSAKKALFLKSYGFKLGDICSKMLLNSLRLLFLGPVFIIQVRIQYITVCRGLYAIL